MPSDPLQAFIYKTKNPIPGVLRWGADYRGRNEYLRNATGLNKSIKEDSQDWWRHRGRIWSTLSLGEVFDFNSRIIWEGRNWFTPDSANDWDSGETMFDILNFSLKKPEGIPLTITAGRQEISLGDKWLVFDGTPYDGSRTLYLDAIRLTLDLDKIQTKVEGIFIDQDAQGEHWIGMIHPSHRDQRTGLPTQRFLTEQDEQGAILWVENRSLKNTELDGYFIYKRDSAEAGNRFTDNADIYTFGGRMVHDFNEHWKLRDEIAGQFGRKNGNSLQALGSLNRLAYYFNDKHKNWLRLDYEYMSGDRPGSGPDEAFDPLWGRWPRFSELWPYLQPIERRPADLGNFHRLAMGWSTNPIPQVEILADYHLLFADQNTYGAQPAFSESGKFRGQLLTCWLRYQITPQISGDLVTEFFFPGDYYDKANNDPAMFMRGQVMFTY